MKQDKRETERRGALRIAQDVGAKAAASGFDWEDYDGPLRKIYEELGEFEKVISHESRAPERLRDELGDILFSVVNLARHLGIDAEEALQGAVGKFERRFARVEEKVGDGAATMEQMSIDELEELWQESKSED